MTDIKSIKLADIKEFLAKNNEKDFRAKQIYQWLWQKNAQNFEEMSNLSKNLREKLEKEFIINPIKISTKLISDADGSSKYTFSTHDNLYIEGVLIPEKKRLTACISTQVGCPLGCKFCATGTLGLKRNLNAAEIYEQVFLLNQEAEKLNERRLTNIVIMGMGEPLLNFDNTMRAIHYITSNNGMGMSPQRITLSTVGLVKQIKKLADSKPKFNLAISLHTAINSKRSQIMPANIRNPLPELIEALKYYYEKTQNRIIIEYLLIGGVTDTMEDAKALVEFCKNVPTKINLIEFNPVAHIDYKKSKKGDTFNFELHIKTKHLIVTYRKSRGQDINAACGQLALKRIKK